MEWQKRNHKVMSTDMSDKKQDLLPGQQDENLMQIRVCDTEKCMIKE